MTIKIFIIKISGVKVIGSLNDIKKYKKHHFF